VMLNLEDQNNYCFTRTTVVAAVLSRTANTVLCSDNPDFSSFCLSKFLLWF
jgi:hypothetical protein